MICKESAILIVYRVLHEAANRYDGANARHLDKDLMHALAVKIDGQIQDLDKQEN